MDFPRQQVQFSKTLPCTYFTANFTDDFNKKNNIARNDNKTDNPSCDRSPPASV